MKFENAQNLLHEHIVEKMPLLERQGKGFIEHPYLVPSYTTYYNSLFTWDHYFMAMRFAGNGQPEYFRYLVDNIRRYRFADGYMPSKLKEDKGPVHETPLFHAQPFLMRSALAYYENCSDLDWLREAFADLADYLNFYHDTMFTPMGLYCWKMPYHSGIDNNISTCLFPPETVICPDINAWLYMEYQAGIKIAALLERIDLVSKYNNRIEMIIRNVNDLLWFEQAGSYCSYDLTNGKHIFHIEGEGIGKEGRYAFQTFTNLIPLYAGLAEKSRAEKVINRYILSQDHFLSDFGIRSLSRSSSFYHNAIWGNPSRFTSPKRQTNSNAQGPVWFLTTYIAYRILLRYGFSKQADYVRESIILTMARTIKKLGVLTENWNAQTGEPLYVKGFGSWNILADVMEKDLEPSVEVPGKIHSSNTSSKPKTEIQEFGAKNKSALEKENV